MQGPGERDRHEEEREPPAREQRAGGAWPEDAGTTAGEYYRPDDDERGDANPAAIRAEDMEPYMALQYVARLFKIAALVVIFALAAEVVAGLILEGAGALLPLLAEVVRGTVLAAILWGAGDLTILLIDVGHDVRAARVLLGRLSARAADEPDGGGRG
jgi:hypothetical protein